MLLNNLQTVREEFGAPGAVVMTKFHVGVGFAAMFDQLNLFLGGIVLSASLATFQRMNADNHFIDLDGAQLALVDDLNDMGRAKVGAGAAADTAIGHRNHPLTAVQLFHLQGRGTYNLFAYANT